MSADVTSLIDEAERVRQQRRRSAAVPTSPRAAATKKAKVDQARRAEAEQVLALVDKRAGNLNNDEFAAKYVRQDDIKGPSLTAGQRFTFGLLGDTLEERQATASKWFSGMEIQEIPDTDIVVYRRSPSDKWKKADQGFFESFEEGVGNGFRELGRDLADFGGNDGLNILLESAAVAFPMAGKAKAAAGGIKDAARASRFLPTAARAFIGGAGAEFAEEGVQAAAGTREEKLGGVTGRSFTEGLLSVGGIATGKAIQGGFNVGVRGAGAIGVREGGVEALEAAKRLGIEGPTLPQLAETPVIQRLARQVSSVGSRLRRQVVERDKQLLGRAEALVDRGARNKVVPEVENAFKQSRKDILELAEGEVRHSKSSTIQRAKNVKGFADEWWRTSGEDVDFMFNTARSIEEPELVLDPVLPLLKQLDEGVFTPSKPYTVVVDTGTVDAAGKPITRLEEATDPIRIDTLSPSMRKEIEKLLKIDPSLPPAVRASGEELSRTDRIRAFIKNLRDEALPGPEGPRQSNIVAGELRGALQEILDNPVNANPDFVRTWKKATRMARERFETREALVVVDLYNRFKQGRPRSFINGLIDPNSKSLADDLIALRRASGPQAFEEIRQAHISEILRRPDKISERLDMYDEDALRLLFPKGVRGALTKADRQIKRLYKTNIPAAAERHSRVRSFVGDLIDNNGTAGIDALKELMGKTRSDSARRSLQAAITDEIVERARAISGNVEKISGKKLREVLKDFDERGVLDLLPNETRSMLGDVELVARIQDMATEDAGTAMRGAETIAGVAQARMSAIVDFVHLMGTGRVLASPMARRALIGSSRLDRIDSRTILELGSVALRMATDIESEESSKELEKITNMAGKLPSVSINIQPNEGG